MHSPRVLYSTVELPYIAAVLTPLSSADCIPAEQLSLEATSGELLSPLYFLEATLTLQRHSRDSTTALPARRGLLDLRSCAAASPPSPRSNTHETE